MRSEKILDRKMRNLKRTYKTVKDNNKKTSIGRGRIGWEWYNDMENIFREDRTINIGPTLASMISSGEETNSGEHNVLSSHLSSVARKGEQFIIASNRSDTDQTEEDITDGSSAWCVRTNNLDCFTNTSLDSVNFYVSNWLKNCAEFKFSYMYKMENEVKLSNQSRQSIPILYHISNDLRSRKNRNQKNTRAKALYDLRKKQLDCEERRVNAINKLKEAINEHNIQKERNDILRQLIRANRTI